MNHSLETLNHRWGRVKEFIHYTQPQDFKLDMSKLTKNFFEDTMDEELIQYMQTQPY